MNKTLVAHPLYPWLLRVRILKHHLLFAVFGVTYACRQHPSCMEFTLQSMKAHGTIPGLCAGVLRALRCW